LINRKEKSLLSVAPLKKGGVAWKAEI
jgi:hypothetical protein